ncbi:MAG: peptidylprolyl isomerase [Pirellulales bacterium]|nr:peptidylprolyl isomerase [Pirellulales bacterium]
MYIAKFRTAFIIAAMLSVVITFHGAFADTIVHFTYGGAVSGGYDVQVFSGPTPVTAKNFLRYVNNGLYDNSIIHRDDFNVTYEGGAFTLGSGTSQEVYPTRAPLYEIAPFDPIVNESGLSNVRGTIGMEKNAGLPDSATSKWYVNIGNNTSRDTLNGGYTVFGKILGNGMTFIDDIDMNNPNIATFDLSSPDDYNNIALNSVPLTWDQNLHYFLITISSAAVVPAAWNAVAPSGDWGASANWGGAYANTCVPDGAGSKIVLDNQSTDARTLNMASISRTVGSIKFTGSGTAIASSGGILTLDNIDKPAEIDVTGIHSIAAPVVLAGNAKIFGSGTLTLSGGIGGARVLTVYGATVNASSVQVDSLSIGSPPIVVTRIEWQGGAAADPSDWSVASNWIATGSAPGGPGSQVGFGNQSPNYNTVNLNTAGQTVGDIRFAAGTGTTIMSSGGHGLTLNNLANPAVISVAGTHIISVPVILGGNVNISGTGTLSLSGGISGAHALKFTGNVLNASSVRVDALTIGGATPAAVPEPSALALLGVGFAGLFAIGRRLKMIH